MIATIKSIWFRIANLGVDASMPRSSSLRLRMLNQIMVIMIVTSLLDSPMYYVNKEWGMLIINGLVVISFLFGLVLSAKADPKLAQHYFVNITVAIVIYSAYAMGSSVNFYVFIYPISTIVYFLFNHERTQFYYNLYFLVALIAIIFFSFELTDGVNSLSPAQLNIMYGAILGFVIQVAALTFLHREFRHFMQDIVQQQTALKDAQKLAIVGSWEVNQQEDNISMSEQMEKMFGHLIDKKNDFKNVFSKIMPQEYFKKILTFKKTGDNSIKFNYNTAFLGDEKWFNVVVTKDDQNRISGIIQDITERKVREQQIEQLLNEVQLKNEQLQEQSDSLIETNNNLKRSNEELEQFAYIASHDLQEPLRMVGNFVQLLEEEYGEKLEEEGRLYVDYAVRGVTRMSKLIDDLLQYSRVGRNDNKLRAIDLKELLGEIKIDLSQFIKEKNAIVELVDLPKDMVCDPNQMNIIFQNLIHNGIKFNNNKQPKVEVKAIDKGDEYLFYVKDNGIGIETSHYERIFEIFKRLHRKEVYSGTGIGLSLCKRIVLSHKGEIWLESEKDKGSTFYFTIPKSLH